MSFTKASKIGGLLICRKESSLIYVNRGEIIIEIVEINGKTVRMAFKASKEIIIARGELLDPTFESKGPKR